MEFSHVTRKTQLILDLGSVEAKLLRQTEVDCIHIFLAILVKPFSNEASDILRRSGIRLDHARDIARSHVEVPHVGKVDEYPFTNSAVSAVERARQIAVKKGEDRLTRPEHLLYAVLEQYDDCIDEVLDEYDVSASEICSKIVERLREED